MKFLRLTHKWIGLIIGLFLFISCFTGAFIEIGKLLKIYAPVFSWMKTLHRTLFLGSTGSQIIGSATLLLIIEIITGYCIWGKVAKARINSARHQGLGWWSGLKRSLRWRSPNMIMGCHTSGGFWSGIPLLLMALTGLTWSFGWYGEMVFSVLDPDGKLNLFHSIANIHTGNFIAPWSRLLWLICAIIGATLPITGYIIFFKSKSHK